MQFGLKEYNKHIIPPRDVSQRLTEGERRQARLRWPRHNAKRESHAPRLRVTVAKCHSPLLAIVLVFRPPPLAMQTINRFLYGPTPEEKVRAWQAKLRSEQRVIEREMRQVRRRPLE